MQNTDTTRFERTLLFSNALWTVSQRTTRSPLVLKGCHESSASLACEAAGLATSPPITQCRMKQCLRSERTAYLPGEGSTIVTSVASFALQPRNSGPESGFLLQEARKFRTPQQQQQRSTASRIELFGANATFWLAQSDPSCDKKFHRGPSPGISAGQTRMATAQAPEGDLVSACNVSCSRVVYT